MTHVRSSAPGRRFAPVVPVAVGALGLAILGAGHNVPLRHGMENDLTTRSHQALVSAGFAGLQVTFVGRDGTVTGSVAAAAQADQVLAAVREVEGVRVATAKLDYPGVSPGTEPGGPVTGVTSPPVTGPPVTTPSATTSPVTTPAAATTAITPSAAPSPAITAPPATTVAAAVTVQAQLKALAPITFEPGSTRLTAQGKASVHQAGAILLATPDLRVTINGYTDDEGDWDVNLALSTARADTVRRTLIDQGIDRARLTHAGYSENYPAVPNTSDANRAINRRVEFIVHG